MNKTHLTIQDALWAMPEQSDADIAHKLGATESNVKSVRLWLHASWVRPRDSITRKRVSRAKRDWVLREFDRHGLVSNETLLQNCKALFGTGMSPNVLSLLRLDHRRTKRASTRQLLTEVLLDPRTALLIPRATPTPGVPVQNNIEYASGSMVFPTNVPPNRLSTWWRIIFARMTWSPVQPQRGSGVLVYRREKQQDNTYKVFRQRGVRRHPSGWDVVYQGPIFIEKPQSPGVSYTVVSRPATFRKVLRQAQAQWVPTAEEAINTTKIKSPQMLIRATRQNDVVYYHAANRRGMGSVLENVPDLLTWVPLTSTSLLRRPITPTPEDTLMVPTNTKMLTSVPALLPAPAPQAQDALLQYLQYLLSHGADTVSVGKNKETGNLCIRREGIRIDFVVE